MNAKDSPLINKDEVRDKIDRAIQDHLIIGVDSGQAYFRETDFVIDEIEKIIKLQQEALLDRFEAKLTDELGYHPPNEYSSECSQCEVRTTINKLRLEL
jgi:hypothetical protein